MKRLVGVGLLTAGVGLLVALAGRTVLPQLAAVSLGLLVTTLLAMALGNSWLDGEVSQA